MDSLVITDDDRQTPSNDRSSSNDISSTTTEELLSVYEDDQQQISSTTDTLIRPVKVDNHISLPNLKIKHPCQTHDNYPFNTGKKMIINKHVKVSHINRSDLRSLNTEITLLRLNNLKNRQTTQMTSRQSTVRICRVSTADNINQDSNKKVIASKYMVTKLPLSNELPLPLPLKMKQNELHVSVKHVSFAHGGQYLDIHRANLDGQTFLITGAAGGIGKATACELAKRGARVILFARSTNLTEAINDVRKVVRSSKNIVGYPLDLADLRSIKACVEQFMKNENRNTKITALINNAGVMACPYTKSKDGFELQMGTNHFGHFYFTQLLLPRLQSSRIINVSSAAHFMWSVPCDASHYAQMCNPNTYHPWSAYSLSKTANILFTRELQRRYSTSYNIRAYSLHPGSVNTQLDRHIGLNEFIRRIVKPIRYVIFKTSLEGAQTNLYCALSDEAKPGEYHADCQPTAVFHKYAKDDKLAQEWWDYSEEIINDKLKDID